VQVQVLVSLRWLQRELGMGMIFVTHDQVAVMYAGASWKADPSRAF
jgi:ABC-type dipeptide/oligopeptide/nickel transport system ATPase component